MRRTSRCRRCSRATRLTRWMLTGSAQRSSWKRHRRHAPTRPYIHAHPHPHTHAPMQACAHAGTHAFTRGHAICAAWADRVVRRQSGRVHIGGRVEGRQGGPAPARQPEERQDARTVRCRPAHICARTRPHLRRDPAHICPGTTRPTSSLGPRLGCVHVRTATAPVSAAANAEERHFLRDRDRRRLRHDTLKCELRALMRGISEGTSTAKARH
jgi:hypothetical protein